MLTLETFKANPTAHSGETQISGSQPKRFQAHSENEQSICDYLAAGLTSESKSRTLERSWSENISTSEDSSAALAAAAAA